MVVIVRSLRGGGWLGWWFVGGADWLLVGPGCGLLVAAVRWAQKRSARPRIVRDRPGEGAAVAALAAAIAVWLAGVVPLLAWCGPAGDRWVLAAGSVVLLPLAAWGIWRLDRAEKVARAAAGAAAAAEWAALRR